MIELSSTGLKFQLNLQTQELKFELLDQTLLPAQEKWIVIQNHLQLIECIQSLRVRGAPLIGVAAVLGLAQAAFKTTDLEVLQSIFQLLYQARPTAVNLMNCLDRMQPFIKDPVNVMALMEKAVEIYREDENLCARMSENGASLIQDGDQIITHCNTGGLATAGIGTALGAIIKAHRSGKKIHVYVDETRPLLQGGRLTAWELQKHGVPMTLIADNMAAHLMSLKRINKAFVGSDRIAINGDFANKIGTYSLAVNCHHHQVPFYVVAPSTTVDKKCLSGSEIHIEQRPSHEVTGVRGSFGDVTWAPEGVPVFNPAFDVTPFSLTTGWVLETGVLSIRDVQNGQLKNLHGG